MAEQMKVFRGDDGTEWSVDVRMPTASNAMIVFRHPGGDTSGLNRYAWHQWHGPEARSVTSRVSPDVVLKSLGDDVLSLLFRRSMPISPGASPLAGIR